jgi:hypothetical protein
VARTKLEIDKAEFQKVVSDLEGAQTFINPSMLWKAVEGSEWAKGLKPRALTAAVAYSRAKELGIVVKTAPGKRSGGFSSGSRGVRVPRSKKMEAFAVSFAEMRADTPKLYLPLIEKAEKGSLRSCIKLKCLECSAWQSSEVRNCNIIGCSLYPVRPFQGKKELAVVESV